MQHLTVMRKRNHKLMTNTRYLQHQKQQISHHIVSLRLTNYCWNLHQIVTAGHEMTNRWFVIMSNSNMHYDHNKMKSQLTEECCNLKTSKISVCVAKKLTFTTDSGMSSNASSMKHTPYSVVSNFRPITFSVIDT